MRADELTIRRPSGMGAINAAKTHCPKGHPLVAGNLEPAELRRGLRSCTKCAVERSRIRYRKDKEKFLCRSNTRHAIRRGKLKRLPCVVCGKERTEAHHEDYKKPLEVIWLCRQHHRERHGRFKRTKDRSRRYWDAEVR
jgi:hypothetical protein